MEDKKNTQENELQGEIDINKDKNSSKNNSDQNILTIDEYPQFFENNSKFSYRFITQYQNEELNKFKDEVLSFFKNRDKYFLNLINSYKCQIQTAEKNTKIYPNLLN